MRKGFHYDITLNYEVRVVVEIFFEVVEVGWKKAQDTAAPSLSTRVVTSVYSDLKVIVFLEAFFSQDTQTQREDFFNYFFLSSCFDNLPISMCIDIHAHETECS